MRSLAYVLTFLLVIGLAFWAYRENYDTQDSLTEVQQLQQDIGAAREKLGILRAEWAYLNRPDRLRELADQNFERLQLMPLSSTHFGRIDQVAYPALPKNGPSVTLDGTVELSSEGAQQP